MPTALSEAATSRGDSTAKARRPRLVYVVTHGLSARSLLRGQLAAMQRRGFDVTVIAAPGPDLDVVAEREGVAVRTVPMPRTIAMRQDTRALAKLYGVLRELEPDIVNAGTTKAGLLGMVAAWMARVPVRIYTLRGLRLETIRGAQRAVLWAAERLAALCSTRVVAVSPSLARKYVAYGFAPERKVVVLGDGSSNGIDAARFEPRATHVAAAPSLRAELGIEPNAPVIGFVGRFVRDKGIVELMDAFERVRKQIPEARLLLVGDFEDGDPVPEAYVRRIEAHPGVARTGFVADVVPYYFIMDVLAFPSHREGFPNVPLEAAVAGVPTVGAAATGTIDAVDDGVSGIVIPIGETDALADALLRYLDDEALRERHGAAARERVARLYPSERIWEALAGEYVALLDQAGCPLPTMTPTSA